jgi:hypothetical protein
MANIYATLTIRANWTTLTSYRFEATLEFCVFDLLNLAETWNHRDQVAKTFSAIQIPVFQWQVQHRLLKAILTESVPSVMTYTLNIYDFMKNVCVQTVL